MSLDDSGEDLFITQSTFRTEENVATQEADEAAHFLLDASFDLLSDDTSRPEVVQYMDFTHEHAEELAKINTSESMSDKPAFVPLMPDLFDDSDVDKVCMILLVFTGDINVSFYISCLFFVSLFTSPYCYSG